MSESLPNWPRRYFEQPSGKPFLFFIIYGQFGNLPGLSAAEYRSAGIPAGLDLSHFDAEQRPDVLTRFQEGYLWDELQSRNSGLAKHIAQSRECLILRGEIEDCDNLNYLRDSVGLLTFLLDHGGITVYDPFSFQWWEPELWRERHLCSSRSGSHAPRCHSHFRRIRSVPDMVPYQRDAKVRSS